MASVDPTDWGPAFWANQYGLDTFDEFYEKAGPLLQGFGFGPLRLPTEAIAQDAYYAPGGGIGTYVAGRLLLDGDEGVAIKSAPWAQAAQSTYDVTQENTMTTLIIPNAFQVSIEAICGGQPVVNVIGVVNSSGDAAAAAALVKYSWEAAGGPLSRLSSLYQVVNYRAVDLSSAFGDIADLASTSLGGIASPNTLATLGACALVQWNGSTRSRSTRGRLYFGPLREDDINPDGRTVNTTSRTSLNNSMIAFRANLSAGGYPLAVLSRKNSTAYTVSSSSVETVIATQRRRIR